MSKKPIIRWTIGNVSDYGFLCLEKSVELMRQLLGNKCGRQGVKTFVCKK